MQVNGPIARKHISGGWGKGKDGGAYNRICLQVNMPIAGAAYKRGGGEGSYKRQFTGLE